MTINHKERVELKKRAKIVVKSHYWILVLTCLFACIIGLNYKDSLKFLSLAKDEVISNYTYTNIIDNTEDQEDNDVITSFGFDQVINAIESDSLQSWEVKTNQKFSQESNSQGSRFGILQFGRSRGVLAMLVNNIKSGRFLATIVAAIQHISGGKNIGVILFIILALILIGAVQFFFIDTFEITINRIFLEARTYETVPMQRFLFLLHIKRILKVAWVLFIEQIYLILWCFTIVGIFIKSYSYSMVPFILAENPNIKAKDAITLSRKMMNGHKWEKFKLSLSFLLWNILGFITLGLVKVFWLNAYETATNAEFYALIREDYKKKNGENHELLCDKYLYEHADRELICESYHDVIAWKKEPRFIFEQKNIFLRTIQKLFGIVVVYDENELKRREQEVKDSNIHMFDAVLAEKVYPNRLYIIEEKEKIKSLGALRFLRCYSLSSLILIFFFFSILGYVWEVSLHLITDGVFVNRGALHGPWLPIYGFGGILITLLLYRFRKKPWLEFGLAVLVSGLVEYFTSWYMEMTHGGMKWWDYHNYFLNLNGRVCAEGLIVFGLGGIAVVYLIAPILDDQFTKIPRKICLPLCLILLLIYGGDSIYSSIHPNAGKGITDYTSQMEEKPIPYNMSTPTLLL